MMPVTTLWFSHYTHIKPSLKIWQVSSFWKVHYFYRMHSEQRVFCENKIIVFTFYSPPSPKLLGFPSKSAIWKITQERIFISTQSNSLPRKEQYRDISASVTFSKGHTHWCPGVCDGHCAQGTTLHLLLFLDTFHHESVCKAPSADIQWSVLQNGSLFLFPMRFVDLRRYFKGALQQ